MDTPLEFEISITTCLKKYVRDTELIAFISLSFTHCFNRIGGVGVHSSLIIEKLQLFPYEGFASLE